MDLRRVVELVNRTNQFNLTGSRTSVRETSEWLAGPGRYILLTDGADKFGQMGIICVAFVELGSTPARIPIFVLSCRVFGYGFETVMLNAIGRLVSKGRADQPWTISGLYQETPLNEPCRAMYPDHGFTWHDGMWIIAGQPTKSDPPWLEIRDSLSA